MTHPLLISVSHGYAVPSIRFATKRYAGQLIRLPQFHTSGILTVTVRADSRLPKSSKMVITAWNEQDSSKIAQETPSEIQRRIFWCYKNVRKKKILAEISPKMNQKMTGNGIVYTTNRFYGH